MKYIKSLLLTSFLLSFIGCDSKNSGFAGSSAPIDLTKVGLTEQSLPSEFALYAFQLYGEKYAEFLKDPEVVKAGQNHHYGYKGKVPFKSFSDNLTKEEQAELLAWQMIPALRYETLLKRFPDLKDAPYQKVTLNKFANEAFRARMQVREIPAWLSEDMRARIEAMLEMETEQLLQADFRYPNRSLTAMGLNEFLGKDLGIDAAALLEEGLFQDYMNRLPSDVLDRNIVADFVGSMKSYLK